MHKIYDVDNFTVDMVFGDEFGLMPPIDECKSFASVSDYEELCTGLSYHLNMNKQFYSKKYRIHLEDKLFNLWFCFVGSVDPKDTERLACDIYSSELFKEKGEWGYLLNRGYATWGIDWSSEEVRKDVELIIRKVENPHT